MMIRPEHSWFAMTVRFGSVAAAQRVARDRLLSGVEQLLRISLDRMFDLSVSFHLKQPFSDSVVRGWFRPEAAVHVKADRRTSTC
jgi:hypothetical protein